MREDVLDLATSLRLVDRGLIVVVTGAGISLASGIPTFRGSDPDAVWKRDITELGTFRYFREDPVGSWQWYLSRFDQVLQAQPNPAHHALVALERWQLARGGRFLLVTQNVDTLHQKAGARELVAVHGRADRVRCSRPGCQHGAPHGSLPRSDFDLAPFLANPSRDTLPHCPACGALLRQHVLWFDEYYQEHDDYQWSRVQQAADEMHFVLFVGTSFAVGVTDLFLQNALLYKLPAFTIDPAGSRVTHPGLTTLRVRAEELLPAVCGELGAPVAAGT